MCESRLPPTIATRPKGSINVRSRTASTVAGDVGSTETARVFVALSIAFLVTVLIRTAWIADDAAIELRVVENFVAGLGLRWNIAERVQAYTDPLGVPLV